MIVPSVRPRPSYERSGLQASEWTGLASAARARGAGVVRMALSRRVVHLAVLGGATTMASETEQLEQRVSEIEKELARLRSAVLQRDKVPWWRQILGEFEGDEDYGEIVRLGQELRRAERPDRGK